ncbi:MAG: T9SS type A sorting domain-containing protein [Candidatus Symbiothrix sp.]|jgi:hypothetical protein|nr:T9SS type A sorting domain-containing protein [Candidatus Symbiothrix sp.]
MKKLSFLLVSGLLIAAGSVSAQTSPRPENSDAVVILAEWESSPGSLNSSSGDKIDYTKNPYKTGINTSNGVGKLTHKTGEWAPAEIQAGRLRRAAGIKPEMPTNIHLGYYDSFEFKELFPVETMLSDGGGTGLKIELRSDGPDRGTDPNVVRENWESQYVTYPMLPTNDLSEDLVDQWFKVERGGIISGRELGMVQVGFRLGAANPSNQATIYLDDFIFHAKKSNRICTYRETFFIHLETDKSWTGDPNQAFVLYPGKSWEVTLQTGKERWVGHAEIQSSFVDMQYEAGTGRGYYLRMDNESPDILIEDIEILPDLINLQLEVDVRTRAPKIEYRFDNSDVWQAVDFNSSPTAVGSTWNTFVFDISTGNASKVALRISSKEIPNSYAYIDNLTIYGIDPNYVVAIPGVNFSTAVRVYPNPVVNTLHIDGDVKKTDIYDMQGRLVISDNSRSIDVSDLKTGMYVTKLHTDNGAFSSKVFKK